MSVKPSSTSAALALGVGVALTAAGWSRCATAQSLTDALTQAYTSNPRLLGERAQLKITDESVPQALANWRPSVSAQVSANYLNDRITDPNDFGAQATLGNQYPGNSYGLTVTQNLYRGGRTVSQTKQAYAQVGQEKAKLLSVEETVLLQVVTDYVDLARDQAIVDLATRREADASGDLGGAKARLAKGEATRVDVSTAEAALDEAVVAHQHAETQMHISFLAFERDTGLRATVLAFPASPSALPATREQASDLAASDSFDVAMAQFALRAAKNAVNLARGQGLPTITLQGTLEHQNGLNFQGEAEDVAAVTIQGRIPIYAGGQISSQIRAAKVGVDLAQRQLDETRAQAVAQAGDAWEQFDYSRRAEAATRGKTASLTTSLEGFRRQQVAGEKTFLDVLDAEQALFAGQISLIELKHDKLVAQYTLNDAVGRLTAKTLGLPVSFYDPNKYLDSIKWGPGR